MKRYVPILLGVAGVFVVGCVEVRDVSPQELSGFAGRDTPLNNVTYIGSDSEYHYFHRQAGKSLVDYKVRRSELTLNRIFAKGSGEPYVWLANRAAKPETRP
jgi:hypothetical protein